MASRKSGKRIHAVALQLVKHEPARSVHSMSLSWREGTRAEALEAAMEFVRTEKPGFAVSEYLIAEIGDADGQP